ncbi:General substrate transporter [Corchorus capsularis]|uniref:General substrate transporter n=1 Tax=Corchorus capsularis TaxID=210143 RepID=A0A1R3GWE8_COCAP|nr:General substrate transporter [Corchorus capsularis]
MEKNELFEGLVGRIAPADQEEYSLGVGDRSSYITFPVIFSTLVAVSDSYAFGNAVGYSSPVANGIMEDLGLSVAEYAVFGSANTVGGMLGALFSGKIADIFGRRGAMGISDIFCITGWLAILFSKVGYSSPVANGIMEDLGLSLADYAVFGSANTVGGMLGALFSGKIADILGRRGVRISIALYGINFPV